MRQSRPGLPESQLLLLLFWLVTLIAPGILATPDASSGAVEKFRGGVVKFRDVVNGRRSVNDAAGVGAGNGVIDNGVRRDMDDFELEDFVLLATVDGRLSARDRQTGTLRWELLAQEPSVQSTYHRKKSSDSQKDLKRTAPRSVDEDEDTVWMVSPTENGELYFYTPDGNRLQKLGVTLKDIVHNMPYRPPGLDTVYNGSKNTTVYAINAKTGDIERIFNPLSGMAKKTCITNPDAKAGDEQDCDAEPSKLVMIGMTEYVISIQNYRTGELLWTIKYKEWTPNNSDMDLRLQHIRPKDNRFIYSRHDGFVFGFEEIEGGNGRPEETIHKFNVALPSPVVRVFDVIKYVGKEPTFDSNDLLVLPQPGIPRHKDTRTDRTFVGFTEEGTCFAMSEEDFPFITHQASNAKCYDRSANWDELPESERLKLLVGVHHTHGPGTNKNTKPRLLSLPGNDIDTGLGRKESSSPSPLVHATLPLTPDLWDSGPTPKVLSALVAVFLCAIWFASKATNLERFRPQSPRMAEGWRDTVSDLTTEPVEPNPVDPVNSAAPVPLVAPVVPVVPVAIDKPLPSLPIDESEAALPVDGPAVLPEPMPATETVEIPLGESHIDVPQVKEVEPILSSPKPPTVRFVEEPVVLETPKDEGETTEIDEELQRPTTPVQNGAASDAPSTPETKKKRKRGSRGKGKKNRAAAARAETMLEGSDKGEDWKVADQEAQAKTSDEKIKEKTKIEEENIEEVSRSSVKTIIISDGNVGRMGPGSSFILSKLDVDDSAVIGHGSNGTVVFRGRWEDKPVAVKRIQTAWADIAEKEVKMLQDTDYHPNIVRYHCRQQHAEFLYIALELCPGSLQDWVMHPTKFPETMRLHSNMRDILLQCLHGLHHLHELKIVHRDIKPQNILVGYPKGKDPRPRFLISDFGLCRKLQLDEYSFGATTNGAQPSGTIGWRARELLTDSVTGLAAGITISSGGHSTQDTESASSTDVVVDPLTKRRATRAIDIFAMGCVFYYVLSGGKHPFGDRLTREYHIVKGLYNLGELERFADEDAQSYEAQDLIAWMIHADYKMRPDTGRAGAHPFFWSDEKRLEFLCTVSDRFELEDQKEKADAKAKSPMPYVSSYIPILEKHALPVVKKEGWLAQLDEHLSHELAMNKRRGYDGSKLLHLLRMIRNKSHHFSDMEPAARVAVGEPPDRFMSYFTHRFPHLVMEVHRAIVECGFDKEKRFEKFFAHPFVSVI